MKKFVLLGVLLWLPIISMAGSISLKLDATVTLDSNSLYVKIAFQNRGDEAASEFQPIVWMNQRPHIIEGTQALLPGHTLNTKFESTQHPFQEPGLYYLPVQVRYRDQNGSRFKLPYLIRMEHGDVKVTELKWNVPKVVVPEEKSVELTLSNQGDSDKTVTFSSSMAMNIGLELPKEPVILKAKERRTWNIPLKHRVLWPNIYDNYLMATYSENGYHHTAFGKLRIEVIPDALVTAKWFENEVMIGALIVLCLIAIVGGYGPMVYQKTMK